MLQLCHPQNVFPIQYPELIPFQLLRSKPKFDTSAIFVSHKLRTMDQLVGLDFAHDGSEVSSKSFSSDHECAKKKKKNSRVLLEHGTL
ncbi:hypothetical protein KC19_10G168000 [Ceratodon purpureus]|uniref:Uncharacterized protein n=1 Tax=Ceratodon purpureus TaxID=3225 RepID=A0A8T0GPS7_CERPU|nr:hypothetical protein KC19_10G168000 [Ceratodon purpureus]